MPKKKYLVETSAVPVALGGSTAAHCMHFRDAVVDGKLYTSVYIRKEFIRRWIRDCIKMAFQIDHFQDLPSAMHYLNQEFGRGAKTQNYLLAEFIREKGNVNSGRDLAKEFARLAIGQLKKFDRRFLRNASNSSKCQIGGKQLKVDFNHLFDDLRAFLHSVGVVTDCPVNAFLGLSRSGRASRLLQAEGVQKTEPGKKLSALKARKKWITCKECSTIGDAVIALEQPRPYCLVHIDKAFQVLCRATQREHKQIESLRAIEKDAPKVD